MKMIMKTAETRNQVSKARESRAARGTKRAMDGQTRRIGPAARAEDATESLLSLKQELEAVRREHGKLQQAIYEAAQVQRRLCAPREMVWGDFEIAGESFPVRHLSGDFFKVMELGSELGLALGDIAGKGLSAGIWQAHLMGVMQRCARTYERPCDAIAGVNRELCQDFPERPITALFFARLEADLRAAVPRAARSGTALEPAWMAGVDSAGNGALAFSRAGAEFALDPGSAGQRLGYRLRDGSIEVLYWGGYDRPRDSDPTAYALLSGVTQLRLSYLTGTGLWVESWPLAGESDLPRAARVAVTLASGEQIERWLALR